MFHNCLVTEDISQVRPEEHIHPDDIFCEESSRAAEVRHKSFQGASRVAVSVLIWI